MSISGCTVYFLTPELDARPIIAQAAVPVAADTPAMLAARILTAEQQALSTGPAAGGHRHGAPRDVRRR